MDKTSPGSIALEYAIRVPQAAKWQGGAHGRAKAGQTKDIAGKLLSGMPAFLASFPRVNMCGFARLVQIPHGDRPDVIHAMRDSG
jgi:hypothetical protein